MMCGERMARSKKVPHFVRNDDIFILRMGDSFTTLGMTIRREDCDEPEANGEKRMAKND